MKKLLALLMALALAFSFAACGKEEVKLEEPTTAAPLSDDEIDNVLDLGGSDETTTAVEVVTDKSGEEVTNKDGEKVTEVVTAAPKPEKEEAVDVTKWSTEQVLTYYKAATAKVVNDKPGYTKLRAAGNETYNAGGALLPFKDTVFSFLGIGDSNKFEETVAKGTNTNDDQCGNYLRQSELTAADVTSAKMAKSGNNYVITIAVKPGKSYIEGGDKASNNSPIDKAGICIGNTDRSGFDHKNAVLVYNAIKDFAGTAVIDEETHNGKVVATVTPDGKITKLVISWDASANLSKILASKGSISATTTVTYDKFGW